MTSNAKQQPKPEQHSKDKPQDKSRVDKGGGAEDESTDSDADTTPRRAARTATSAAGPRIRRRTDSRATRAQGRASTQRLIHVSDKFAHSFSDFHCPGVTHAMVLVGISQLKLYVWSSEHFQPVGEVAERRMFHSRRIP